MKRLIPLALFLAACNMSPPCPTIVYAGGSIHSPTVAVSDSLVAETPGTGTHWVCQRLMGSRPTISSINPMPRSRWRS